jgi:hypothetical protein
MQWRHLSASRRSSAENPETFGSRRSAMAGSLRSICTGERDEVLKAVGPED